jgi:hypothetical protein
VVASAERCHQIVQALELVSIGRGQSGRGLEAFLPSAIEEEALLRRVAVQ